MNVEAAPLESPQAGEPTRKSITQEDLIFSLLYPDKIDILSEDDPEVLEGCPVGLEPLAPFENLMIIRRPENQTNLPLEQRFQVYSQYDIVNTQGKQVFVTVEKTNDRTIFWVRDARLFNLTMYNHDCRKILSVKRKWGCFFCFAQYYCFFCFKGFHGGGNASAVTLHENGENLGRIVQKCSLRKTKINIFDKTGTRVLAIKGKLLDGRAHEGMFDVFHYQGNYGPPADPVAMIESLMSPNEVLDFYKVKIADYEDPYGITFFSPEITPEHKALLICAVMTMDFIFCKPNTDYPHWLQFVPIDYRTEPESLVKVFRDESKEIIVTTLNPEAIIPIPMQKRKCSCCRWFWGFLCLCCPLGMSRNALRCMHLIAFMTVMSFLGTLGLCCIYWRITW